MARKTAQELKSTKIESLSKQIQQAQDRRDFLRSFIEEVSKSIKSQWLHLRCRHGYTYDCVSCEDYFSYSLRFFESKLDRITKDAEKIIAVLSDRIARCQKERLSLDDEIKASISSHEGFGGMGIMSKEEIEQVSAWELEKMKVIDFLEKTHVSLCRGKYGEPELYLEILYDPTRFSWLRMDIGKLPENAKELGEMFNSFRNMYISAAHRLEKEDEPPKEEPAMAKLSTKSRNKLPKKEFGLPSERAYPLNDKAHSKNALARVSQQENKGNISSGEAAKVRKKAKLVLKKKSKK